MHFGATLRLLRLQSGLGLRDLARRLGVSSTYLSRVENGIDPAPTPARLEELAREIGVPAALLMDLAQRVNPFLEDYLGRVPEARTLFLDIARRGLEPAALVELQDFLAARFPSVPAAPAAVRGLSDLLAPERVIVGFRCARIGDALEVVAGRLAEPAQATALASQLRQREKESPSAIGSGVAVPTAVMPGVVERAALITFASPLKYPTPDKAPLRTLIVMVGPPEATERGAMLAHVARLAARDLGGALEHLASPAEVVARLRQLELLR